MIAVLIVKPSGLFGHHQSTLKMRYDPPFHRTAA